MGEKEYVIMFDDGTLHVDKLYILVLLRDIGVEFEELGEL